MFVGVVIKGLVAAGCEDEPKTDVGGGPKADRVTVPAWDPPGPSVDGCPNADVCCVLPKTDGVEVES